MAHELPFIAAIDEAIRLEMERDDTVLYFGQNMATTGIPVTCHNSQRLALMAKRTPSTWTTASAVCSWRE